VPTSFFVTYILALSSSKKTFAVTYSIATNRRHQASTKRTLPYNEAISNQTKGPEWDGPSYPISQKHSYSRGYFVMKIENYLIIASTALVLSLPAMAQGVQHSTNEGQLVAANAELVTKLDAKTAKAGDMVTAKLTSSVRLPGSTELKRNTLLTGHIDQVQAAVNNGVSTIVLTFDKAQPKGGQAIAIKSTIVGIYPTGTDLVTPDLSPQMKIEEAPSSAHGYGLTSDVQGSASAVLKADGKNVHVGDGTELQFALAPIAAAGSTAAGN
jgi:hypothetical protein